MSIFLTIKNVSKPLLDFFKLLKMSALLLMPRRALSV
jgi:hypothetical protein